MWFTENPWPPFAIAGVFALVFAGFWNVDRRNLYLYLAALCLALGGGVFLIERIIVTEREQLEGRVQQLCRDFQAKDPHVVDYVSASKPDLRLLFAEAQKVFTVGPDLTLSDFRTALTGDRATVHFRANATITILDGGMGNVGRQPARLILTLQREGAPGSQKVDDWKIIEVRRMSPFQDKELAPLERTSG